MIKKGIKIKNNVLPAKPGVYKMKNVAGEILYIGKATSLAARVSSYWNGAHDRKTEKMVSEVAEIDYEVTGSVLEALFLEATLIKKHLPLYNIDLKDDKSWIYVCITKDDYPRVLLKRGLELEREDKRAYKIIFGPFLSASSVRAALDIVRKIFPYSTCVPGQKRACFNYHLGRCPGVCIGAITPREYKKIISHIILFFRGKKKELVKKLERDMKQYAKREQFEDAARTRNQLWNLQHINDVAMLKRNDNEIASARGGAESDTINIYGRIEGYDISNISGTSATGSMVVFERGESSKNEYRKFKIKTVRGPNDYAMMREVLRRRFGNAWPLPDIILIDGGAGQVGIAQKVLDEHGLIIPVIGIAKGIDRKKDDLIFDAQNPELARIATEYKHILVAVRDEAHRFAVRYHRELRARR